MGEFARILIPLPLKLNDDWNTENWMSFVTVTWETTYNFNYSFLTAFKNRFSNKFKQICH